MKRKVRLSDDEEEEDEASDDEDHPANGLLSVNCCYSSTHIIRRGEGKGEKRTPPQTTRRSRRFVVAQICSCWQIWADILADMPDVSQDKEPTFANDRLPTDGKYSLVCVCVCVCSWLHAFVVGLDVPVAHVPRTVKKKKPATGDEAPATRLFF